MKDKQTYICGVEIPSGLLNEPQRAKAYAAGYTLARREQKIVKVPKEFRKLCKKFRGTNQEELLRSDLKFPEITKEESSYWAGYITGVSSLRDITRSDSREFRVIDAYEGLTSHRYNRRSFRSELLHMSNEDIEDVEDDE